MTAGELVLASGLQTDDSRGHFEVAICKSLRAIVGQGMRGRPCCRSMELQAAVWVVDRAEWAGGHLGKAGRAREQLQVIGM